MSKLKILLLFSWFSMLFSPLGHSIKLDSAYIENLAKTYLQQQLDIPDKGKLNIILSPIDPRVKIKTCDQPLVLNIPENHNSRNVNVKISCKNSNPWWIFIPAKISVTIPIVIAANYIARGSTLNSSNIQIVQRDAFNVRGEFYSDITELNGVKSTKSISKGKIVTKKIICLVCKGERVTIKASSTNFAIQTTGIALSDGILEQSIEVKNSRSGRTISARVKAAGQVEINF
jgi:flagellar basal body P-ring formation protein FlgA